MNGQDEVAGWLQKLIDERARRGGEGEVCG